MDIRVKPLHQMESDIVWGSWTIIDTGEHLADAILNQQANYYEAIETCSLICNGLFMRRFFVSATNVAKAMKRMILTIDTRLARAPELPTTAERIPYNLFMPAYFSENEAFTLLGQAVIPLDGCGLQFPTDRAIVANIRSMGGGVPGNYEIGLHWGRMYDDIVWGGRDVLAGLVVDNQRNVTYHSR